MTNDFRLNDKRFSLECSSCAYIFVAFGVPYMRAGFCLARAQPTPTVSALRLCTTTQVGNFNTYFKPVMPPSFTASPGIPDMRDKEPVDFFCVFFDHQVMNLILVETTRYAEQYLEKEKEHLQAHPYARANEWRRQPLSLKEVEAFIALLIAMGMCGFPTLR